MEEIVHSRVVDYHFLAFLHLLHLYSSSLSLLLFLSARFWHFPNSINFVFFRRVHNGCNRHRCMALFSHGCLNDKVGIMIVDVFIRIFLVWCESIIVSQQILVSLTLSHLRDATGSACRRRCDEWWDVWW